MIMPEDPFFRLMDPIHELEGLGCPAVGAVPLRVEVGRTAIGTRYALQHKDRGIRWALMGEHIVWLRLFVQIDGLPQFFDAQFFVAPPGDALNPIHTI